MNNLPPISTLFGYTKAIIRPTPEYLSLLYNHCQKTEKTNRMDDSYASNNIWSLIYYYFTYPIEIHPKLYLGNIINAANYELLKEVDIDSIFNVTSEHACYFPDYFNYQQVKVKDNKNSLLPAEFHTAVEKLHEELEKGNTVLVHCHHGRSRSVALILAYLLKYHPTTYPTFKVAYETIKRKKPIININTDFATQLKAKYETS